MKHIKLMIAGVIGLAMVAVMSAAPSPTACATPDAVEMYGAKCKMCHGANAEKAFDAGKAEEVHVKAILEGVKPKMPSYKITEDEAKALVAHMKSLKK